MNLKQYQCMKEGKGFIAALDQSGGSTPRALALYGIPEDSYEGEEAMFELVHQMRSRIITDQNFTSEKILAAILFEQTMESEIDGKLTADYLWEEKGIVPLLKVDSGLDKEENGVQLMKPIDGLGELLDRALERNIFGTKMRSVIKEANEEGIRQIVAQQFDIGRRILAKGLVPILEPEVDIHAKERAKIEAMLKEEILEGLKNIPPSQPVMFKLTIPVEPDFYKELIEHPSVLRVVALSGGFSREKANELLAVNPGLIASFSRALSEGLSAEQSDEEFSQLLGSSVDAIYEASII